MEGVSTQQAKIAICGEGRRKEGRKEGASKEGQLEYDLRSLGLNHASKSAGERREREREREREDDDDNDAGRKGCSDDFRDCLPRV